MPHQTEPNANNALAVILRAMLSVSAVRPETSRIFPDYPVRHANFLITAPGTSPAAVEAEYEPGSEVEYDAGERLGLAVIDQPRPVEDAYDLDAAIADAQLPYCVLYDDGTRFTTAAWS